MKTGRALLWLAIATVTLLAPFAAKAFSIDDPIFLWTARHLQSHPLDPYGFLVNWSGVEEPIAAIANHPPLTAYYIAGVASLFGWSEIALHLAFLLPALAAVLGAYLLARRFCGQPLWAALGTLITPAFLVCSASVMADTLLLACWVWSVVCWVRGLERHDGRALAAAMLLAAGCVLTKPYGLCLTPLLFAYALIRARRPGWWAAWLAVPLLALAGYQWAMRAAYGRSWLLDVAAFAAGARAYYGAPWWSKGLIGLVFVGGCLATTGCYAPVLWSRRALTQWVLAGAAIIAALALLPSLGGYPLRDGRVIRWPVVMQLGLWAVLGAQLLLLAVRDWRANRDGASALLGLWVAGTFVFTCFVNPVINGRSLLPMVPAAAILVMRALERRGPPSVRRLAWPLVPALAIALSVAWGDAAWANTGRAAARAILAKHGRPPGHLWFQGHWGFQYYMEAGGARAFDVRQTRLAPEDLLVLPLNNTGVVFQRPPADVRIVGVLRWRPGGYASTMSSACGAGFHADVWGPLPFAFGAPAAEAYAVMALR